MFSDWTSADWTSNATSLLLFFVAYVLSVRQGDILKQVRGVSAEVQRLQEATAELEIREKIGVIEARTFETRQGVPGAVFMLQQDTIAVLPLYEHASQHLRSRYEEALSGALSVLSQPLTGSQNPDELARAIASHADDLEKRGLTDEPRALRACLSKVVAERPLGQERLAD